jgi:hypothetical protein
MLSCLPFKIQIANFACLGAVYHKPKKKANIFLGGKIARKNLQSLIFCTIIYPPERKAKLLGGVFDYNIRCRISIRGVGGIGSAGVLRNFAVAAAPHDVLRFSRAGQRDELARIHI